MKNKTIYMLLIVSSLFSQIQKGGTPKFYNNEIDNIDYVSPNAEYEINRQFHPMVFQFGDEYDLFVNILEESRIIENNDETS